MELDQLLDRFVAHGIHVFVASANDKELAEKAVAEWGIKRLRVGYGVTREDAARWGLFGSAAIKDSEPEWFVEPGLFVIRPNGELYASIVQTMPFQRPSGESLLGTLEWILEKGYPARGDMEIG